MQNTKQTSNKKTLVIYVIIVVFSVVVAIIAKSHFSGDSENYPDYNQLLNSATGGVLGLIIIVTMYYLGKLHDYRKDFLETMSKVNMTHNLYLLKLRQFKSLSKGSSGRLFERSKKMSEDAKSWERIIQDNKQLVDNIFKFTKPRHDFLILTIPFAVEFGIANLISNQTEGDLYFQSSVLVFGTATLLLFWRMNEQTMQILHKLYGNLFDILTGNQRLIDGVDDIISDLKEINQ